MSLTRLDHHHDFDFSQPFRRRDALAMGITQRVLQGPRFTQVLRGVWIAAGTALTPAIRARAISLVYPEDAYLSHLTAARLLGIPVPSGDEQHVTVRRPADRRERVGVVCHLRTDGESQVLSNGLQCSVAPQLADELADVLGPVDLAIAGDAMLTHGLCDWDDLQVLARPGNSKSSRDARLALSLIREGSESPRESQLRVLLNLAKLPEPMVNYEWISSFGTRRRFDLCWPSSRVIVEYDGRHHIERQAQWQADLRRREEIERAGWRILVITAADMRDPSEVVRRVHAALAERGQPGLHADIGPRWKRYFA